MTTRLAFILGLGCALLLAGCGGGRDGFYRLSATDLPAAVRGSSGLSVSVGPVSLPSYIDRTELVFQNGPNEFQLPTNARWIGSLQENIGRVVASDLGALLHSNRVRSALDKGAPAQYRVALDLRKFHGISGSEAVLDLSWRIERGGGTIVRRSQSFRERIIGDGYEPMVAAESRLLGQAAQAIAASLRGR
ncbi:MAG: PqiC family protein [Verrucomicrobiota bacterium]|nr:PqiC family protein [Verrucomicrobiota bacterium]